MKHWDTFHEALDTFHEALDTFHEALDTFHEALDTFHEALDTFHEALDTFHLTIGSFVPRHIFCVTTYLTYLLGLANTQDCQSIHCLYTREEWSYHFYNIKFITFAAYI